ncbi:MAG TPA: HDOD domain-containing protein [Methylomirabilota bacterium]|nr:HDOD domain-containing protein [Methylomirabilota bacterium]
MTIDLVSPSPSLLPIEEQIRRGDGSSRELASLIASSPALAVRVLRMANSEFRAPIGQVSSLSRGITMLGDSGIRQVVLTSLVLSRRSGRRSPKEALASTDLIGDAVLEAAVCRNLAALTWICSSDEAFAAGLLHDLGQTDVRNDISESHASDHSTQDFSEPVDYEDERDEETTRLDNGALPTFDCQMPRIASASPEHHDHESMSLSALVHASAMIARKLRSDRSDPDDAAGLTVDAALVTIGVDRALWASRLEDVRDEYDSLLTLFKSMAAWLGSTGTLRPDRWSPVVLVELNRSA